MRKQVSTDQSAGRVEDVLLSNHDSLTKVRLLMSLGCSEEVATDIVERYQLGQQTPVYYERLMTAEAHGPTDRFD